MTRHFLLSEEALSLREIFRGAEEKANETFWKLRWQGGEPICQKCGCLDHYEIKTRRKFKCAACQAIVSKLVLGFSYFYGALAT
ncbi:transposase [Agrobacterium salinitolerans]|uniref:transposase n=1 Tax=Pseudomonadota TaxID=1224 RepID=UPI003A102C7E